MDNNYYIHAINGPVIDVRGGTGLSMLDMVYVSELKLPGEVVSTSRESATVQVYEDTSGLKYGQPVFPALAPLSLELGPGLLGNIFDGIARPLKKIEDSAGVFITRGFNIPSLDGEKLWDVTVNLKDGDNVTEGMIFAECVETPAVRHRFLIPPGVSGTVHEAKSSGAYRISEQIAVITQKNGSEYKLTLSHKWPIRVPRPVSARLPISRPLITGQRVIDTLFPIGRGGCAAIPGPFGAGKTMVQHQLAKWSDADIIVYLGCGERGNEMTQVLEEFSELVDPKSGRPLMERTILIANTSNMPVAAREASIYTGVTIAEYYRDMGYHVALMADSTSRWAEALREISGRLEEMPAEEAFPAYLPSRLAEFYERAGFMKTLNGNEGSVTIIGAVSPQGGDFSEPVTQNTKRFTRCFWALDRALAYARHFPAINWTSSYSEYFLDLAEWYDKELGADFTSKRQRIITVLHEESALQEIVKLIGTDILPDDQKLTIETAKLLKTGFLQQNAFHKTDTYMPLKKQYEMIDLILRLYDGAKKLTENKIPLSLLRDTGIYAELTKMKFELGEKDGKDEKYFEELIDKAVSKVMEENV